jgi:putative endonuclease
MFTVYFLYSQSYDRYYVGVTGELNKRLSQHNSGQSKSTKPFLPWLVVYTEQYQDKQAAYKREFFLKSPAGYLEKKKIIASIR